jgi:hypothetical protein
MWNKPKIAYSGSIRIGYEFERRIKLWFELNKFL